MIINYTFDPTDANKSMALWEAAIRLYFAAYWKSDRLAADQEKELFIKLRDALGLEPGQTSKILGESLF